MSDIVYAIVPRLFPGETIAILAPGPSLTPEDAALCRRHARVIAVKDCIRLVPDADVLYGSGDRWWKHYGPTLTFAGPRYSLEEAAAPWASILKITGEFGIETDPGGLRTGRNSGYQAINLAVHLGARRIVLVGFDMRTQKGRAHWFGTHPWGSSSPYEIFLRCFPTLVEPLKAIGVEVLNASRASAIDCFRRVSLEEALAPLAAVA